MGMFRQAAIDAQRVRLHARDVREAGDRGADVLCAQNFSYQCFHERRELADYFRRTRQHLSDTGVLVLDVFGGSEAVEELREEREIEDGEFTYVWEQKSFHPAMIDNPPWLCKRSAGLLSDRT